MNMAMSDKELAQRIVEYVGGKSNIQSFTHCATRLRMILHDEGKAQRAKLEGLKRVLAVVPSGGQYQIVIGDTVAQVYAAVVEEVGQLSQGAEAQKDAGKGKAKNIFSAFLDLITGVFQPTLGVLTAGGIIRGLLALLVAVGVLDDTSGTYAIMNAAGYSLFYFFPVVLGYSSAKKFGVNPVLGMAIGGAMIYPDLISIAGGDVLYQLFPGTPIAVDVMTDFLGIPVAMRDYTSSVIPVIVAVYFASKLVKLFERILPQIVRKAFLNCFVLAITVPVSLIVIGPVISMGCTAVGNAVTALFEVSGVLTSAVLGLFWQILVMFGLHWGLLPVAINNLSVNGYDYIFPVASVAAYATGGAVLAIFVRSRNRERKTMALESLFPIVFSAITEPAIYSLTIPLKKPFWCANVATALGGIALGLFHTRSYFMASDSFFGAPFYIEPDGTLGMGFWGLIIAWAVAIIGAFVLTMIVGFDDTAEEDEEEPTGEPGAAAGAARSAGMGHIALVAPVAGRVVPLEETGDEVFASKVLGDGAAIIPADDNVCAPVAGTVRAVSANGHAIGLVTDDGREVFVHIGRDTSTLKGVFTPRVAEGDHVDAGQVLVEFKLSDLADADADSTVFVLMRGEQGAGNVLFEKGAELSCGENFLAVVS